ncbi:CsgG/HfaB family protein [Halocola ammonii]
MRLLPVYILALVLTACNASKQLVGDAREYEKAGMEEQAFQKYREAYVADPGNVNAHVGLKQSAEKILLDRLGKARAAATSGDFEQAQEYWERAVYLIEIAERYKVNLTIPLAYQNFESEVKSNWITRLEEEAYQLLLDENYELAEKKIAELKKLDPTNKQAEYLGLLSEIYPKYRQGVKAYELGLFRDAYEFFDEVVNLDADFKDALVMRNDCLEKEQFTLAYIPVHHEGVQTAFELSLAASLKQAILDLDDPFLVLLNRDNMQQLLEEQQKSMNATFSEDQAIEAGNLIGAQYIITGEIVNFKNEISPKRVQTKKGYAGSNRLSNKITYEEVRQQLEVNIQFRFEVMNVETGQVYLADNISYTFKDEVRYAEYDGNYLEVYAGEWKLPVLITPMDEIYNSPQEKHELEKLFEARRQLPSSSEMEQRALFKIANGLKERLKGFRP